MAKLDDNYTRITNNILNALSLQKLSGAEFRILLLVIRKTYGWHKTSDKISIGKFMEHTGINRSSVCRALKCLVSKKILGSVKSDTRQITTYSFQKDYTKWGGSIKKATSVKSDTSPSVKSDICLVSKVTPTKETIQKKLIKEILPSTKLLKYFGDKYKEINGHTYIASFKKDTVILKDLLNVMSEKDLTLCIDAFFESDDKFILEKGHTLGIFKAKINQMRKESSNVHGTLKKYLK